MATLSYGLGDDGIATITFDAPGAAVNTMTPAWQHDLAEAAARCVRDKDRIRGVLLASAKPTFFAGAALGHVMGLAAADAAPGFAEIEALKQSYRALETLGRPVVALLAGSALGGGWEVALIAHARFALDDEAIRFGMPEVSLGLIPGATGITKTVRHLGLLAARPYLLEGRLLGPAEAARIGWVDGLAGSAGELRALALDWIAGHADAAQPWDRKGYRLPGGTPDTPAVAAALAVAPAALAQATRGLYPAPQAILEAMVEGAQVDYETATRIESRKLAKIMVGRNAKNMIGAFFFDAQAVRAAARRVPGAVPWRPDAGFATRVAASYRAEGEAMRAEGVPAVLIEHAGRAAGMAAGSLASDQSQRDEAQAAPAEPMVPAELAELSRRLLYAQAVEAARCLAEGVPASAAEANLGSIEGAGFPAWTGGAIRYAASEGVERFLAHAAALSARHGPRFEVAPAMREVLLRAAADDALKAAAPA